MSSTMLPTSSRARVMANASRSISSRSSSTSSIRIELPVVVHQPWRAWQREPDAGAAARLAVDADAAAVGLDDPLGYRQAQPDAWRIGVRAHAIKTFEQAGLLLGRDAWPLILHADPNHSIDYDGHHRDSRVLGTVLRGVRQQVRQHLTRVALVRHNGRPLNRRVDVD